MIVDFDIKTFCQNLRATKPPYECPVKNCGKIYKSFCGIQFHLYNYDHENPTSQPTPKMRKKKGRWHPRQNKRSPSPEVSTQLPPDGLRYTEQQKTVEVDLDGHVHQLNVSEPLDIVFLDGPLNEVQTETKPDDSPKKLDKSPKNNKHSSQKVRKEAAAAAAAAAAKEIKLPEPKFRIIPNYEAPNVPPMPISYFRFIEKSAEELDEEVEYDMDEEDCAWLDLINTKRKKDNFSEVSADTFELLMDRLEKESYFESQNSGANDIPPIDEDAVCCICNDGECQNSNAILFCDMCNLAVHQECYGVPYIPEGQWLCRRCLQSPSRAVDCVLCPNKGGAFKQTDDSRWAHVVCALWIPEVCFANTVFLEPLDNIENIPPARWKLTCYICKQRSVGACIQCHKANCYTAFHVTCAQQAGLHMKMEAVRESGINGTSYNVRKTAYCDVHTPVDADNTADDDMGRSDSFKKAKAKAKSREKMRKARKILAEKRSAVPVVSLPTISPDKLTQIASMVSMSKKHIFMSRLVAFWTLKRQSRNGVPLLRRLQTTSQTRRDLEFDTDIGSLSEQLQYWQRLRQDLEKARLLVELIRKREKLKREYIRTDEFMTDLKLRPLVLQLREIVHHLVEKDVLLGEIFAKPVDLAEVPDYLDYIKSPMDLETMMTKVNTFQYPDLEGLEVDFGLMIKNCLTYNSKETIFYKAALKMREQAGVIFSEARTRIELAGFDPKTGVLLNIKDSEETEHKHLKNSVAHLSETERESGPHYDQLKSLQHQLVIAEKMKLGVSRSRKMKHIKMDIVKLKRRMAIQQAFDRRKKRKAMGDVNNMPSIDPIRVTLKARTLQYTSNVKSSQIKSENNSIQQEDVDIKKETSPPKCAKPESPEKDKEDRGLEELITKNEVAPLPPPPTEQKPTPRPVGRPRKSPKYFKKSTPPPPAINESPVKDSPTTPPPLVNSKPTDETHTVQSSPETVLSSPSSKGISPPILKPQVPYSDSDAADGPSTSRLCRRDESLSPVRSSSRIRSLRSLSHHSRETTSELDTEESDDDMPLSDTISKDTKYKSSRTQSRSQSESDAMSPNRKSPRKSRSQSIAGEGDLGLLERRLGSSQSGHSFLIPQKDSFKVYRSNSQDHVSDTDDNNTETTSESARSSSGSSTETSSGDESDVEDLPPNPAVQETAAVSLHASQERHPTEWNAEEQQHLIPLQPLDLVWAKCRGYPWYPALIISPDIPNSGYFHNGVPIPVPPKDVLALRENYVENVFLVLFFDTKRTWQWLTRDKLAPLGVDSALDKARLVEPKKTTDRKAVKKAYENAIYHRCRVTGESNSLSGESGNDN